MGASHFPKKKNNNYILLIDEPETNLHVKAQRMIHKLLLEFSQNNQIIISTHSTIFMQELNDEDIKYVRRDNRLGTYIDDDNVGANNYKKIRESLGLAIRDTLLLNEKIIAVEGEYDVILHEYIFNRIYQDNRRYSFLSIEGADNAKQNIIALKQILNDDIVIILDNDGKGKEIKEKIERNEFIKTSKVLFQPLDQDGELEDLFNKEFLKQVIEVYIRSNKKELKDHFNEERDEVLEEYAEKLEGFTCFSEIEKIVKGNNKFNLKNKKFYKRIIRILDKLTDEEFNKEVRNIKKIYELI